MAKRSAREVAAELGRAVANAREAFMESATRWVRLRHGFLIKTGKQPDLTGEDETEPRVRNGR